MTGVLTDCARNIVLDMLFSHPLGSGMTTLYVGLAQNTSNKRGMVVEPSADEYTRIPLSKEAGGFSAADAGTRSNTRAIDFPKPSSDWGKIQSVFLADDITHGNILVMADLLEPQVLTCGSRAPSISPGMLRLRLS